MMETMQNIILKRTILAFSFGTMINAHAFKVDLEILGQGQVQASNTTCSTDCQISTDSAAQTLVPMADSGWHFDSWQGQKCDMGNGVIIQSDITDSHLIGRASGGAKTLETIDFNNDGLDDLMAINLFDGEVLAYENLGNGSFSTKTFKSEINYPSAMDSFDWNNDGYQDLFIAEYGLGTSGIKMYLNDGNGDFIYERKFTFDTVRPYAFSVVDYDLDGLPDIVVSSFSANISGDLFVLVNSIINEKITWFKNNGDALIEQNIIAEKAAITLDTFQQNEGETPLILTAEITSGEIVVYSGQLGAKREVVSKGGSSYGAAFGDIDENGKVDILAAHYKPAELTLALGKGNALFSSPKTLAAPSEGLTATAFGDFNNDSLIDVATGEFNKKKFYFYATKSYEHCIIKKASSIKLTAVFTEGEPDNSKESGGSMYSLLLLMILLKTRKSLKPIGNRAIK